MRRRLIRVPQRTMTWNVPEKGDQSRGGRPTRAVADRTRVGVVGCGLIAQVMHLPYLTELSDHFEIAALCDIRETVAAGCAERFGVPRVLRRREDLLEEPLDAVLIATSDDHAPIATEAARAGLHVPVEKPMATSRSSAAASAARCASTTPA